VPKRNGEVARISRATYTPLYMGDSTQGLSFPDEEQANIAPPTSAAAKNGP